MKRQGLIRRLPSVFCIVSLCTFALAALQQDRRIGIDRGSPASRDTTSIARDLSDKAQDAWNIAQNRPNRTAFDLHIALGSFAGGALAYFQMTAAGAEARHLEAGARKLVAQAREIDSLLGRETPRPLIERWRLVRGHVSRLSEAYRLDYATRARDYSESTRGATGRPGFFRWKGKVDGSDWIMLRGDAVTIRHLTDRPIKESSYELPSPLPCEQLTVRLNKLRGRGRVEIIQQPGLFNDCTVIVLLEDPKGGDDWYEFELTW